MKRAPLFSRGDERGAYFICYFETAQTQHTAASTHVNSLPPCRPKQQATSDEEIQQKKEYHVVNGKYQATIKSDTSKFVI